jgi:hypothetical protein
MRLNLILLAALALDLQGRAAADVSLPAPSPSPGVTWQSLCAERLRRAQAELVAEEPAFAVGQVTVDKKGAVHFEARVADREHARFYGGAPAHFFVSVVQQRSKGPGQIGVDLGNPNDSQASIGITQWTTRRKGVLDVQIVEGKNAFRFAKWFKPALAECLR